MIDILHQKPLLGRQINWAHPLATGLVGCWVMNERTGGIIYDLSGNDQIGTLTSAWSRIAEGISKPNTTNQTISCVTKEVMNINNLTVACRARPDTSLSSVAPICGRADSGFGLDPGDSGWILLIRQISSTDRIVLNIGDGTGVSSDFSRDTGIITNDKFHSFCAYKDSTGNTNIVFDGIELTSVATGLGDISIADRTFKIGNDDNGADPYAGDIEYIYVWNRPLSADEAKWIHREPYIMFQQNRVRWFSIPVPVVDGQAIRLRAIEKY